MKLIFVYNADSGRVNGWIDIAHKIISPGTYACSLCALTHDTFSEKQTWAKFREETNIEMNFLHKDEFEKQYGLTHVYPVILKESDIPEIVMNATEISQLDSVEELTEKIISLTTFDKDK